MLIFLNEQVSNKKNFGSVLRQVGVVYDRELWEVGLCVIFDASPIFKGVHCELDCHNAVVNIVPKIGFQPYGNLFEGDLVVLI